MQNEQDVLDITFKIDIKLVRKALVVLDQDVPPDEEIKQKFIGCTVDTTKFTDNDMKEAALAFTFFAIGQAFSDEKTQQQTDNQ